MCIYIYTHNYIHIGVNISMFNVNMHAAQCKMSS